MSRRGRGEGRKTLEQLEGNLSRLEGAGSRNKKGVMSSQLRELLGKILVTEQKKELI